MDFDFSWALTFSGLATLAILIGMEMVLSVDNLLVLSLLSNKLPEKQRAIGRFIGMFFAVAFRLVSLFFVGWLIAMTKPVLYTLSVRDLVLIVGGAFLAYNAAKELFNNDEEGEEVHSKAHSFFSIVLTIGMMDLVFSVDNILGAVGVAEHVDMIMVSVVLTTSLMAIAAGPTARLLEKFPKIATFCLWFLVAIGLKMVLSGFHVL